MENVKKLLTLFTLCFFSAVAALLILSGLMHWDFLSSVTLYYFRSVLYCILTGVILLVVLVVLRLMIKRKTLFTVENITSATIICVLGLVLFVTIGPMTMDRSYTIFSLADLYDNQEQVYTADEIQAQFIEKYVMESASTIKRIEEQVEIGNLEEVEGRYRLSTKGKRLVETFRFVDKMYPVEDKSSLYPNQ